MFLYSIILTENSADKVECYYFLCLYEEFEQLLSFSNCFMKCCTTNISKPKNSGEEREGLLIHCSSYGQPSVNKHSKMSQAKERTHRKMKLD